MKKYTPMIQQYLQIKENYQDAFLFFRLGDFYEMFFNDAVRASQILEITLTSRDGGGSERIPMCGIPYHAAQNYIDRLIDAGHKVAICEQVEDPKMSKGVVKREVVQLITPGTQMDVRGLEKENNFIAALHIDEGEFSVVYSDLTTGEMNVMTARGHEDEWLHELLTVGAKEIVVGNEFPHELQDKWKLHYGILFSFENRTDVPFEHEEWRQQLQTSGAIAVSARLLHYLYRTQKRSLIHLQVPKTYQSQQFLKLDGYSQRNLELAQTLRTKERKGSLLWVVDDTKTSMGSRLLKQWILRPLVQRYEIEKRQSLVHALKEDYFLRDDVRELLKEVYDIERLAGRVAFGNVNARELYQLKKSLQQIPALASQLQTLNNDYGNELQEAFIHHDELVDLLERSIAEHPPISIKEGDMIKDGYSEQLDEYRFAKRNGQQWIAELEQRERNITGIKSLKVGFNKVFGYYIEITRANLSMIPEGRYERKQTLSNAERYITPELKEREALILGAEEKSIELEYTLFQEIRERVAVYIPTLQRVAKAVSTLDVLQSFATVAEAENWVCPQFNDEQTIAIEDGRHPVVEKVLGVSDYVPNDCHMNGETSALLITGPNMSGKSTFMRQVALTAVLAQIGSFIPATRATLPIFDQIFTRIGAADDLVAGQSTFMVEMLEAKNAITNATRHSLILFDEIGRGTSTFDGMSLAQAMMEYIHDRIGAKTLFSTHYHELTDLERTLPHLRNVHVSAVEENGKLIFLHKIKEGPADQSYGIHVAELAALPHEIIERAREVLQTFEAGDDTLKIAERKIVNIKEVEKAPSVKEESLDNQLSLFTEVVRESVVVQKEEHGVVKKLRNIDVLELTPMDAMNMLYKLVQEAKK